MKTILTAEEIYHPTVKTQHWWGNSVNRRLGAYLALIFMWGRLSPTTVSILALLTHSATAAVVVLLPSDANLLAAIASFFGWQLAHSLDCADGSLARTRGQVSARGGQIDLIGDYLGQLLVLSAVMSRTVAGPDIGGDLSASLWSIVAVAIAGGWIVGLSQGEFRGPVTVVNSFMSERLKKPPLFRVYQILRQVMDHALSLAVLSVAMALGPYALLAAISVFSARGWLYLAAKFTILLMRPR